jgi:hypothetical protein
MGWESLKLIIENTDEGTKEDQRITDALENNKYTPWK